MEIKSLPSDEIYNGWKGFRRLPGDKLGGYFFEKDKIRPIGIWIDETEYRPDGYPDFSCMWSLGSFVVFLDEKEMQEWFNCCLSRHSELVIKRVEAKGYTGRKSGFWSSLKGFKKIKIKDDP